MNEDHDGDRTEWEILTYPSPKLRMKSEPVIEVTDEVRKKALALVDLMIQIRGIGLAAPQVGWHVRLLTINLSGEAKDGLLFLNPEIVSQSKSKHAATEMCLSVPGVVGKVVRPRKVTIDAMNMDGEVNRFELEGLLARCFLHEADHLDGVLFIDRLSPAKKLSIRNQLKRLGGPE